jgi:predicted transcriptional regulator
MTTDTFVPSPAMLAAAKRFKAAWEAGMARSADGEVLTDRDVIEMHETSLALIWATGTTNLEEALAIFHQLEA